MFCTLVRLFYFISYVFYFMASFGTLIHDFMNVFSCFKSAAFVFITFVLFPFAVVSIILARKHTFQKVWSSIHSGTYVPQPFQEYSMLDLQNQQKGKFIRMHYHHVQLSQFLDIIFSFSIASYFPDRFPDRIDGRGKSSLQNMPIISINVLAKRPQSSNLHKLLGRTHEYG